MDLKTGFSADPDFEVRRYQKTGVSAKSVFQIWDQLKLRKFDTKFAD